MPEILGYADRMAIRPGESIEFKVSCETGTARFRAEILRLRCGDDRPDGPGLSTPPVDADVNRDYPGRRQAIDAGSYIVVPSAPAFDALESFALATLLWPTLPGGGPQTVMGRWEDDIAASSGYALGLDAAGVPVLILGREGRRWQLGGTVPLEARRWYRLLASFHAGSGDAILHYEAFDSVSTGRRAETCTAQAPFAPALVLDRPF